MELLQSHQHHKSAARKLHEQLTLAGCESLPQRLSPAHLHRCEASIARQLQYKLSTVDSVYHISVSDASIAGTPVSALKHHVCCIGLSRLGVAKDLRM